MSKHDSVQAELDELTASIQDLASIEQDVRNKVEKSEQGVHWSCVMMEILISIMTKESKLLRKGAVDSFRQIVEDMDVEAITILGKDIMGQEANTEGYGLGVHEEMETDSEDDEEEKEEDEEEVDGKDESDEEMMDDSKNESSKSEKNNDSDESSEDEAEKNNVDTELRSKLQAVLGKLLKYYFFKKIPRFSTIFTRAKSILRFFIAKFQNQPELFSYNVFFSSQTNSKTWPILLPFYQ